MSYQLEEFEIQGVRFRLKPTSPRNVRKIRNMDPEQFDVDEEDFLKASAIQNIRFLELFAEPIEGEVSDIDPEDLDIAKVTHYFKVFTGPLSGT